MRTRSLCRDCVAERCERLLVNAVLALRVGTDAPPSGRGFVRPCPHIACKFNSFRHASHATSPDVRGFAPYPQMRETDTFPQRYRPIAICVPCTHTSALPIFAYTSCGEFRRFCGRVTPMKPLSVAARKPCFSPPPSDKTAGFLLLCHFLGKARK